MRLKLTNHARDRMGERTVTMAEIRHVLEHVDITMPGRNGAIAYVGPTSEGRRLKVILVRELDVSRLNLIKSVYDY